LIFPKKEYIPNVGEEVITVIGLINLIKISKISSDPAPATILSSFVFNNLAISLLR
jgi:hypothetical protein